MVIKLVKILGLSRAVKAEPEARALSAPDVLKDMLMTRRWARCVYVESVYDESVCGGSVCGGCVFCGDDAGAGANLESRRPMTRLRQRHGSLNVFLV